MHAHVSGMKCCQNRHNQHARVQAFPPDSQFSDGPIARGEGQRNHQNERRQPYPGADLALECQKENTVPAVSQNVLESVVGVQHREEKCAQTQSAAKNQNLERIRQKRPADTAVPAPLAIPPLFSCSQCAGYAGVFRPRADEKVHCNFRGK